MSPPKTIEELAALVRKSGVIDELRLVEYLERRRPAGQAPKNAQELAEEMLRDGLLTAFQADQLLQGKWRGFNIGKYKLLERVGVGGMGQVFLCEHATLKHRVALKVLPPTKADQPSALGRFYREARAAAAIVHPNVVRTHDIGQDGELHYIVMDYVEGSNLLELVKKIGPLDVHRATSYIYQTALGLDCAFRTGIIHRDLKPGNIMIDREGVAKLLDLGLARFFADTTDMLTLKYDEKCVLGTADYVAPEQVANSHAVDTRADIYSLGATFYFLLAGHPPFPTGSVSQKLQYHKDEDPTPVRDLRPEVPAGLAAVISKMMAKNPARRYQTPAQVASELKKWLPDSVPLPTAEELPRLSPAAADPGSPPPHSPRGADSRPARAATALLKSPSSVKKAASVVNEAEIDTDDTLQRTPSTSSRAHFEPPNPFARGDESEPLAHEIPSGSIPWALICAVFAATLAVAVMVIARR